MIYTRAGLPWLLYLAALALIGVLFFSGDRAPDIIREMESGEDLGASELMRSPWLYAE